MINTAIIITIPIAVRGLPEAANRCKLLSKISRNEDESQWERFPVVAEYRHGEFDISFELRIVYGAPEIEEMLFE